MDQTSRPLLIPPDFALYAEKHGIFDLYQVTLTLKFCLLKLKKSSISRGY